MMLFNDDELRFYYENIPVPETDEQRDLAKREYHVEQTVSAQAQAQAQAQKKVITVPTLVKNLVEEFAFGPSLPKPSKTKNSNRIKRTNNEKQKESKVARDPTGPRASMSRDSLKNVAKRTVPTKTKTLRHPPATTPAAPLATKRKVKGLNSPSTLALPQRLHSSPSASPATPKNSTETGQATKKPRPVTPKQFSSNTWNKSVSAIGLSGVVWNNEGQGQNQPSRAEKLKGKRARCSERRKAPSGSFDKKL
jgi:hypothetical protein